ncbi:hypothetical protein ACFTXM_24945 [Streptomyces sp. NPDC056930]|uniref:hypothetical protein n=1 Tax=Streptomyces sp. NPDC056930 TaxID=3345967 RepID=UPI00362C2C83
MPPSAARPLALLSVVLWSTWPTGCRVITRRARAERLIACAAGAAAVRMPPPASLGVRDVTLAVAAAVLPRVHGGPVKALKVTAGGARP